MARTDWRLFLRDAPVVKIEKKKGERKARVEVDAASPAKKKRRTKTSPGVMHVLGVGEARLVRGIAKAASGYAKRSKKSAAARKDGAVRDVLKNVAKVQEGALEQIAKVPRDLIRARELKSGSKQLRKAVRRLVW